MARYTRGAENPHGGTCPLKAPALVPGVGGALGRAGCWRDPGGRAIANNEGLQELFRWWRPPTKVLETRVRPGSTERTRGEAKVLGP